MTPVDHGFANVRPGVYDPGAQAGGLNEADLNLSFALTGKWILTQAGIAVFMTRDDDSDPDPVGQRDDRAETAGCSHFLSIHMNDAGPKASGTETYYRDAQDKAFAAKVQAAALSALGLPDRGLKLESDSQHTRLAVFDFNGPACLVEMGFITNPGDRAKLLSRDCRIAFAQKIAAIFL